jgi:hypothetical protein
MRLNPRGVRGSARGYTRGDLRSDGAGTVTSAEQV